MKHSSMDHYHHQEQKALPKKEEHGHHMKHIDHNSTMGQAGHDHHARMVLQWDLVLILLLKRPGSF